MKTEDVVSKSVVKIIFLCYMAKQSNLFLQAFFSGRKKSGTEYSVGNKSTVAFGLRIYGR